MKIVHINIKLFFFYDRGESSPACVTSVTNFTIPDETYDLSSSSSAFLSNPLLFMPHRPPPSLKGKPRSIMNTSSPLTGGYTAAGGDSYAGGPQRGNAYSTPSQSYHPYRR